MNAAQREALRAVVVVDGVPWIGNDEEDLVVVVDGAVVDGVVHDAHRDGAGRIRIDIDIDIDKAGALDGFGGSTKRRAGRDRKPDEASPPASCRTWA
ncbi:hypothetical protein [Embleya sp. AB8]|uniref:hypothetical protein n=1 Tax=Embleya sp. AB8 TaxID=3156304 RepID=UPI003C74806A